MRRRKVEEEKNDDRTFKIKIPNRNKSTDWRLIFGNINTLGDYTNKNNAMKWDKFKYLSDETQPDIIGISEHNRVISRMSRENRPQEVLGKWQIRTVSRFSWLKNESNSSTYELGGTGIITSGKGSTHTIGSGEDKHGMGRWTWITIQGKQNRITTIISIYRPGKNQTILERQQAHTSDKRPSVALTIGPQDLWDKDLMALVDTFKNKGHELIVAGDWNDDLNSETSKVQDMMTSKGMREIIINRYGKGPETHQEGTTTIDGIFTTSGIDIRQGGYTSHEVSPGDHRWTWIDISEHTMTGKDRDDYAPPVERRATSTIPSVRNRFNDILEKHVTAHQLHDKIEELYNNAVNKGRLTKEEENTYDIIEERMKRGVKNADSRCRKVRRGKIPFSKTAQSIMRKLRIIKLILKREQMKGNKNRPKKRKLKRLARKYEYDGPLTYETLKEITEALKNARQEYNEFKPRAHELRENYLHLIALEIAEEDNQGRKAQWHLDKLKREEATRDHFHHIRRYEGKANRRGVDKVVIQLEDGTNKTVHEKEDIARHIRIANIEKRQQARHTPCRQEPLSTLLGEQMEYEKWEEILKGTIQIPEEDIEEGTKLWYDMISASDNVPFDIMWTTEEYCQSWQRMSETKSSIPGIHAAHMKCLNPSTNAAGVLSKLALIPLITGYAPTSWKQGIDSMIPKKVEGECRPNKLRLILLFDARFNHNNKLIGKKMMEYAEENGLLAKEQFGSRKNKSAIEHAINKRITLDISRQHKSTCIYIANDAKSCYDRILLIVAYLAMRNAGVPQTAALSSIKTLVEMKMKIKTAHGVSETTYGGNEWEIWPHGIGQGNGYGPAIWALISSPLLTIMRQQGYGTNIHSPITKETLQMSGFSFVDDTDQCEMMMTNRDWTSHKIATQESLTLWESLLRSTGGAIEPTKSDWTKLKYTWQRGIANLEAADENDKLYMRNPEGDIQELIQKDPNEARETLGVWQTASGCEKEQIKQLKSKIATWGTNIKRSGINSKETATAVRLTIGKTIRYPLGATTIDMMGAKSINKDFRWAALGKMRVVRTASSIVTAAPIPYGGLGMANEVYENQMIDHTIALLGHGHTKSTTGILLRTSLECLAIEAGVGGDPGSFDVMSMNWITKNTWIGSTLQSFKEYGLELETSIGGLKTWTTRDDYIMEKAYDTSTGHDLQIFNKVRLYLKVTTISDLLTADGKEIDTNILIGERSNSPTFSEFAYTWPNVPKPTKFEVQIWYNLISAILTITQSNSRIYGNSIFKWDDQVLTFSKWSIGRDEEFLYERKEGKWIQWERQNIRGRQRQGYAYTVAAEVEHINHDILPITVTNEKEGKRYITHRGETITFEDDVANDGNTGWILPLLVAEGTDEECFAQQIITGRAMMVSDGSYKKGKSSAAFTTVPEKKIKGSLTIPGKKSDQSSYRAELGGLLASIVYANIISKRYHIIEGQCTMICDSKGALASAFGYKHINPRWKCYDLLCMIRFHIKNSPLKWKHKHVKGHQDNGTLYKDLGIISQANVDVDLLAKLELQRDRPVDDTNVLQGQCWRLNHTNIEGNIQGNIEHELREVIYEERMKKLWKNKFNMRRTLLDEEWDIMKKVNKSHTEWEHLFIVKYAIGIMPTKLNMVRRQHDLDEKCPCCEETEDTDHILQCKAEMQEKTFTTEIDTLNQFLMNITSWEIRGAIIELISTFRDKRAPNIHHNWCHTVTEAFSKQYDIGQRAFISGLWVKEWNDAQNEFQKNQKSRKHGITIVASIVKQIQKIVRELWYSRNDELHKNEQSRINKSKSIEYNVMIDNIFARKRTIPTRLLVPADRKYFRRKIQAIKRMRNIRKERWITDAELVLNKYDNENETEQVRRFRSFFMHRDDG